MKKYLYCIFFMVSNIALGQDYADQRMDHRISQIEKDLAILQKQFYQNDNYTGQSQPQYQHNTNAENAGNMETRLQYLEEQIRFLNGKVEEAAHSNEAILSKFDNLKNDIDFRLNEINDKIQDIHTKANSQKFNKENNETANIELTDEIIQAQYNAAFAALQATKYSEAEQLFKNFISKYETHKLTGNAYFWLGETYLSLKDLENAALNFLYSYKKFPKASKASNALFKLAETLAKLGKKKESCNAYDKLLKNYPNLPVTLKNKSQEQRKLLNCNKIQ